MNRRDVVSGLILALLGILITRQAYTLSYRDEFGPGPGFLPLWLGLVMIALAVAVTLIGVRTQPVTHPVGAGFSRSRAPQAPPPRAGRAFLVWLGLVAVVVAIPAIGFIPSLGLLSFFLVYAIERRSLLSAVTVTAAIALSFLLLFRLILPVPLP